MKECRGQIGIVNKYFIQGWGMYVDDFNPAIAQLYINNVLVFEVEAKDYRPNLENVHPSGNCGFYFDLNEHPLLNGDFVSVKLSNSSEYLKNSNKTFLIKKKKRCIVHIGMHKTGTTSIQEYFYANRTAVDILYPDLGDANHSVPLFSMFYCTPENYYIHSINKLNKDSVIRYNLQMKNSLEKQINISNKEDVLISGEDLIYLEKTDLEKLKEFFRTYYENIEIIAYTRSLNEYLSSALPENLKNEGDTDFNLEKLFPNYKKLFLKFIDVFGKSNVNIFEFNKFKLKDNDIVSDFCSKISIHQENKIALNENKSLSLEAVSFLFIYYKFFPNTIIGEDNRRMNINLIIKLSNIGYKKFKLCNKVLIPLIKIFSDDFAWMKKDIGIDLDDTKIKDYKDCVSSQEDLFQIAIENIELLFNLVNNKELIAGISKDNMNLNDVATLTNEIRNQI